MLILRLMAGCKFREIFEFAVCFTSCPHCIVIVIYLFRTYLYSLTKQDIALRDVPRLYEAARPITHHIKRTIER